MDSLTFANTLTESYMGIDTSLVQHLSMFLDAEQRVGFLEFIGADAPESEDE